MLRNLLLAATLALPLACASTDAPAASSEPLSPEAALKAEAAEVVEAWFDAWESKDVTGAAGLGTKDWHRAELAFPHSFTNGISAGEFTFESHSITGTELLEDGSVKVRVRAQLLRSDGTTDGEGLRFTLARQSDGTVLITDLD